MDTGFYNVKQNKESKIFNWDYILDDGKKISSRNLRDLTSKVLIKGYKWEITNEKLANQSKNMDNPKPYSSSPEPLPIHKPKSNSFSNNSKSKNIRLRTRIISPPTTDITTKTGIKHVQFDRLNHEWIYDNGNKKFSQKYLFKLESDVKKYNLEWIITDESISSKFQNEEYEKILSLKYLVFINSYMK